MFRLLSMPLSIQVETVFMSRVDTHCFASTSERWITNHSVGILAVNDEGIRPRSPKLTV